MRRYSWHIAPNGYPATKVGKSPQTIPRELHRFLLGKAPIGLEWDHENRDKFDNRRSNLRAVTHKTNSRNLTIRRDNGSGISGVFWNRQRLLWQVGIGRRFIGYFAAIEEAAAARAAAELALW